MTKELENPIKEFIEKPQYYNDFLDYLGIDPKDFEDEFDVEFDDYSK